MKIGSASTTCTPTALAPSFNKSVTGLAVNLTGSNTGGAPSYQGWNFGDLAKHTTTATTSHTYAAAGKYLVTYTVYDACGTSYSDTSSVTVSPATSVTAAQANISSSKLYPNPTSDMANIELNLLSTSDVKVTLTDVMGKEVMTVASGTMASLSQAFSVANLHKGIYTVNYFVNGSAAKAELLMVK